MRHPHASHDSSDRTSRRGAARRTTSALLLLGALAAAPRAGRAAGTGLEAAPWPMLGGSTLHGSTSTFLGPSTGAVAWKYASNAAIDGGAAIDFDGAIFFGTANGRMIALEQDGKERWSAKGFPVVVGIPALARDGRAYVTVNTASATTLYAFDRRSGAATRIFDAGSPAVASPAIRRDGAIVFATRSAGVFAVSPAGALLWQAQVGKLEGSAPAVTADGVYVGTADGRLVALDASGAVRWDRAIARKTSIVTTPTVSRAGRIYVAADDGAVRALDASGTVAWTFATGGAIRGGIALGPDGTLYVGSDDARLRRVRDAGASAALVWARALGGAVRSTPVVDRAGAVYAGSDDQRVYALEEHDGTVRWSFRTGAAVRSALAIGVGGRLFAGSNDRALYALGEFRAGAACWSDAFIDAEGLTPAEANLRFQVLLAACGGPDVDSCRARVLGYVNADRAAAALALTSRTIDPSTYLTLIRDRDAKLRALRAAGPAALCAVAATDADGDLVPDAQDRCPGTAPLTPTGADGCPDPARLDAGSPELLYAFLEAAGGKLFDHDCSGRQPAVPIPAEIRAFAPDAIFQKTITFLPDQSHPECGAFYEVEILFRSPATGAVQTFYIVGPRTFGNKGCAIGSITPGLRLFCMATGDPGPQGSFASADVGMTGRLDASSGVLGYRMRATTYDGQRSNWSPFVVPGAEECLPFQCPP